MKKVQLCVAALALLLVTSCGQTNQKDNATQDKDTMVMKQDKTDTATNTISTDTTKR